MRRGESIASAAFLFLVWLLYAGPLHDNLGVRLRWAVDPLDMAAFAQRGTWAVEGSVPYRDVRIEYPPVAAYLFAVPYIVPGSHDPAIGPRVYRAVFSALMLVALWALLDRLRRLRPGTQEIYWLLLPGPLYFVVNRFDVVPALLTVLALDMLRRQRHVPAGVLLASGALTKWYPALLLPLCAACVGRTDRRAARAVLIGFVVAASALVLPTLLTAGVPGVLQPLSFHAARDLEGLSLPGLAQQWTARRFGIDLPSTLLARGCLVLSLLPAVVLAFVKLDSFDRLVRASIVVVGSFVLFARIWSPQWILWVFPLVILAASGRADRRLALAYACVSYAAFPLAFDYVWMMNQERSGWMIRNVMSAGGHVLLAALIARAACGLRSPGRPRV